MLHFGDRSGYRLQALRIPCPRLHSPLRILHLSDAHLLVKDKAKQRFIQRVTDDDYDFVFFTGDICEEPEAEPLVPGLLSRQPRYGAYAVLGNHDHLRLRRREGLIEAITQRPLDLTGRYSDAGAIKARLEAGDKWKLLINEAVTHEIDDQRVVIAGVDDPFTGHGDMQRTMRHVKQADVLIGLVHVPTDLASFSQRGFDLVLSGHTHGGQWRLPFFGAFFTQCDLPRQHARGVHHVERTAVHVSQGLGAGKLIRMRINCPPMAHAILLGG
jgi:predicted MPP superfamily phosphohydrolase